MINELSKTNQSLKNRKGRFLWINLFAFGLLFILSCSSSSIQKKEVEVEPPNLVLILADDLGYSDVGFNGCKDIPTPNIDRIANEGVKFTNGYVTWAACGPSRAGLITGRYQDRFGFSRNPLFAPNDPNMGLPLTEMTLPEALKQADYKSIILGKWHLGAHPTQRPLVRGFDDFFGFLTGGHKYFPELWVKADEYEVDSQFDAYNTKLLRNNDRVEEKEYLTDALSREAVSYIEKHKDNPFFMYVAYNAPHGPLQATNKYLDRFDHIEDKRRKTYAAMVSAVDDGVGRILNQLKDLKLDENTIVVFLSDNGGPSHKNGSSNLPLRGRKGTLYEGGVRVPFAMKWPAKIKAGMVYDNTVSSLDIFGTIVAQNAAKINLKNPIDGVDLIPYLNNDKNSLPHETLFWRIHDRNESAIRSGDLKLIDFNEKIEAYHLSQDLAESNNLSSTNSKIDELKQQKREWLSKMKEPIFLGLSANDKYDEMNPDRFKRPAN